MVQVHPSPGHQPRALRKRSMGSATPAMDVSELPASDIQVSQPVGVFISYASEDHDIAQAIFQSLQTLGDTVYDRINIFLDSKSIEGGDKISDDIRAGLKKS